MREHKGKSLISLPSDYVAIDLETTGFSPEFDEIIEIACIRFRDGVEVDKFQSLVIPHDMSLVDDYIIKLTGITHDMLQAAPNIETVLPNALSFIGHDIIIGHNVSFDINFLYDNCERFGFGYFDNDYVDTRRLARRAFPNLKNYKLGALIKEFGIPDTTAHRAEQDARQTAYCYAYLSRYIENHPSDILLNSGKKRSVRASDIIGNTETLDIDNPLYEKVVVFTGTLDRMTRKEAMQVVADLGGINGDGVTKKTNFLVLGNNDMCKSITGGKSSKHKKAEQYILAGADLMIINENVFYDMLCEKTEISEIRVAQSVSADVAAIPAPGLQLTDMEFSLVQKISSILSTNPNYDNLQIVERSSNYYSIVLGMNDFLRFKFTSRSKWISLRLPSSIMAENISNPLFTAQKNKAQLHWKAELSTIDDVNNLSDFILAACIE